MKVQKATLLSSAREPLLTTAEVLKENEQDPGAGVTDDMGSRVGGNMGGGAFETLESQLIIFNEF